MALTTCLLILALSASSADGDVGVGRPRFVVQSFARPAEEPVAPTELFTAETPETQVFAASGRSLSRVRFVLSSTSYAVEVDAARPPRDCTIVFRRPDRSVERTSLRYSPGWPPTELRWQAAPRRRWRQAVPPSSLPLFWLHERPPLTWPAPRDEGPRPPVFHCFPREPEAPRLCGGVTHVLPPIDSDAWIRYAKARDLPSTWVRILLVGDAAPSTSSAEAAPSTSSTASATTSG